jgi:ABC-type transport system involved in multi-copper enzyme maturation permease subunit
MGAIARFLGNLRIWPGPVLAVELVTMSRRTRFFFLRTLYAAALFLALCFTYLTTRLSDMNSLAAFASAFFTAFGVMQLTLVLLVGPALAAGAIAQERERRTMEYLFATPLSSLEIVIGKLGGRVAQILYLVLSGVPVLALAMLLGGIAPQAILSLTVITLSTVLFVTMVSIAVSACSAKARDAVLRAYLAFFCIWVLPHPLSFLLNWSWAPNWTTSAMWQVAAANPLETFFGIFSGIGLGPGDGPWQLVLILVRNQALVGGAGLLLATLFMRRIHLRDAAARQRRRRRIRFFRGEIGDNPMYWKELYVESGSLRLGLLGYVLLALIFIVVCGLTIYFLLESLQTSYARGGGGGGESFCAYAIVTSTVLYCCGLLVVIARAAGSITAEKERDSWASLISTPLEPAEIIKAKILGSVWSLRGLAPLLAVVWLPAVLLRPSYILGIAFSLLDMAILTAFAGTLGVYCSQIAKSTLRATGAALGIAVLIGGGTMFCCCPISWIGAPFNVPFLLAGPSFASLAIGSSSEVSLNWLVLAAVGAYLIGTIGYAVAARIMLSRAIRQFDKRSGRTERRPIIRARLPSEQPYGEP